MKSIINVGYMGSCFISIFYYKFVGGDCFVCIVCIGYIKVVCNYCGMFVYDFFYFMDNE